MKKKVPAPDEAIEEIRSGRRLLSERAGHDPGKLIESLKTLNTKYRDQIRRYKVKARRTPAQATQR